MLQAAGVHLGSLASADLAARCAEGRLGAGGRAASRRERKRALTAASTSRWAGAITRATEDQWQLAERNLVAERRSLRARTARIQVRLAVPAGHKQGRAAGMRHRPNAMRSSVGCRRCRPGWRGWSSGSRPGG